MANFRLLRVLFLLNYQRREILTKTKLHHPERYKRYILILLTVNFETSVQYRSTQPLLSTPIFSKFKVSGVTSRQVVSDGLRWCCHLDHKKRSVANPRLLFHPSLKRNSILLEVRLKCSQIIGSIRYMSTFKWIDGMTRSKLIFKSCANSIWPSDTNATWPSYPLFFLNRVRQFQPLPSTFR